MTPLCRAAVSGSRAHAPAPVATDPLYANVMALLHGEGSNGSTTFTDTVPGNSWTSAGGASITTAQFKFGAASMDFQSGDRTTISTSTRFGFGTGDYTVECWLRATNLSGAYRGIWDFRAGASTVAPNLNLDTGGVIQFREAASNKITSAAGVIQLNTWHHVALARSGNDTKLFVDGVQVGSTYSTNQNLQSTAPIAIGCFGAGVAVDDTFKFFGQMDEFRVTKGVARYTANFTPPAAEFPNYFEDEHTNSVVFLGHMDGADASTTFTDSSKMAHALTAAGNAQIDTAQAKFGGASGLFDGTGDWISTPDHDNWNFGAGDFTVEAWVRFGSVSGVNKHVMGHYNPGPGERSWLMQYVVGDGMYFGVSFDGSTMFHAQKTGVLSINQWYHIAATRDGATLRIFIDGVVGGTTQNLGSNSLLNPAQPMVIGNSFTSSGGPFTGHIDEVRITKGFARYTANFTPPIAAFPNA